MEVAPYFTDDFRFQPAHPLMMYFTSREQTFQNWPTQLVQKPKDLIQNGFFYTNVGDQVTCFYCGVTLKQCDKSDIAETEHIKWGPSCLFAKMVSTKVPHIDASNQS